MTEQPCLRLIHWKAEEATERAARLTALGYAVNADPPRPPGLFKELAANPPAAVVVDLTRLPSQGRDVGVNVRMRVGSRQVPLVFVGGDPEKVARIRDLLPDATYTTWEGIGEALAQALAAPPRDPVAPTSIFAAFEGRPLVAKPGISVALVDAPEGFEATLGELPEGARLQRVDPLVRAGSRGAGARPTRHGRAGRHRRDLDHLAQAQLWPGLRPDPAARARDGGGRRVDGLQDLLRGRDLVRLVVRAPESQAVSLARWAARSKRGIMTAGD